MSGLEALAPTVAMLAAFALVVFGVRLLVRGSERGKGVLMVVAALVLCANVLIWTM